MALENPTLDKTDVKGYKITLSASAKSDMISCAGARSVYLIASATGVQIQIPDVPASGNPVNTQGTRLSSLIATGTSNAVLDANTAPNTGRVGVIPATHMPPYFFLENTSGGDVDVDVWVNMEG